MPIDEKTKKKYSEILSGKSFRLRMSKIEYEHLKIVSKKCNKTPTDYIRWLIESAYEYLSETDTSL